MEMVCDTPVPYYEVGVSCGLPGEMGELPPEMVLLPSMLTRGRQVFIVNAEGDSMTGVGIYSGDALLIESTQRVHCGEVVMVSIDGAAHGVQPECAARIGKALWRGGTPV